METTLVKVKKYIIEELNLEDLKPEDIEDDAPLFDEGLGLDSLDAVELVVMVEKRFGLRIASTEDGKQAFASAAALAAFIDSESKA